MRNLIQRHPLIALFGLIYLFGWIILIPSALDSQGWLPFHLPGAFSTLAGWAPGLAAIIVTAATGGRAAVKELFRRFLIMRVSPVWYVVALFGMAGAMLAGVGLFTLSGGTAVIPAASGPASSVAIVFVVTVLLGVVLNTEEIAWRGVALPRLQAAYGALGASLILAVPEGFLHLPLFLQKDVAFFQNVGIPAFMLFSFALTVLYTWIFNNTRGSLLIVTLLHASQNAWANLLSDDQAAPFYWTVGLLVAVAIAVVAVFGSARLVRGPVAALSPT